MAMASSEILELRDELLEKEKELSGMQNLLLEQDEDIRACQQRLGELESTLLLACPPSSTASKTGDENIFPPGPASPSHPVQRKLYENASEAAATSDAEDEEQSEGTGEQLSGPSSPQHLSPESSGGGVKTPSTPEPAEEGKSPQLDIYGRRLDRSFQTGEGAREPIADKECDTTIADVRSGDQHPRVESCAVTAAIVGRAERRVEASEAAVREAATAAVTAASEARAAKDETERLRAEGVELSRWREAVLNLRDVLEISQREGQRGGDDGREARSTNENDPVARHAKWVSSPALKTLLPRLHQNARDLLADLAAARGSETSAATATRHVAGIPGADDEEQGVSTRLVAAIEGPLGELGSSLDADNIGEASAVSVEVATAGNLMENDEVEKKLTSLRKECKTLRIVIHALREKDEESQKRIFALEGEVFQASLAAVKQEALLSALRRQLEVNESRDAPGPQPHLLTLRPTGFAAHRSAAVVSAQVQDDVVARKGPSQRLSRLRDERVSPTEASTPPPVSLSPPRRSYAGALPDAEVEEDTQRHPCGERRTPTTDILRRLLYENTPKSSASCAAESGAKTRRIAGEEDCDRSDHLARRSRNGRRLFAEGSTVLRCCPAASDDVAGARRGPSALFSDLACGMGGVEGSGVIEGCSDVPAVRGDGENGAEKPTLLGDVKAVVGKEGSDEVVDQKGGRLVTGEIVLRERLLRARKEFSALRTGAPNDSR